MKKLCVYCGSKTGNQLEYLEAARALGKAMADANIGLVYGGASIGVMGALADSVLASGGHVIGIIPEHLMANEIAHPNLSELIVVETMHERKARMESESDGFIALPGGMGTLEELFEILTWRQLNFHQKPCGVLNTLGFYNHLLAFLNHTVEQGFLWEDQRARILCDETPEQLLAHVLSEC